MRRTSGFLIVLLCLSGRANAACEYIDSRLEGRQVLPPADTPWIAFSELNVCDDNLLRIHIWVYGPETVTAVHVHAPATASEDGPVLFDLPTLGYPIDATVGPLTRQQADWIIGFHGYIDVHTTQHPAGAVRGALFKEVAITPVGWAQIKALYR